MNKKLNKTLATLLVFVIFMMTFMSCECDKNEQEQLVLDVENVDIRDSSLFGENDFPIVKIWHTTYKDKDILIFEGVWGFSTEVID